MKRLSLLCAVAVASMLPFNIIMAAPCGKGQKVVDPLTAPNPVPTKTCTLPTQLCIDIGITTICLGPEYEWECTGGYTTRNGYTTLSDDPGDYAAGNGSQTITTTVTHAQSCLIPIIDPCTTPTPASTTSTTTTPDIVSCDS